jgi:hypothetical protein
LDIKLGMEARIESDGLIIRQEKGGSITLNGEGSVLLQLPIPPSDGERFVQALIQEEVAEVMAGGLTFAAWVLDRIDATQSHEIGIRACALLRQGSPRHGVCVRDGRGNSHVRALVSDLITVLRRRALS